MAQHLSPLLLLRFPYRIRAALASRNDGMHVWN